MTDPTPPPEQPMDDATRARIRARIADPTATQGTGAHRWVLPVAAAVSVMLIAAGGAYAAFWSEGPEVAPAPAIQESTAPSDQPSEPASEQPKPTDKASKQPSSEGIPDAGDFSPEDIPATTCEGEVGLRGAEQVVSWPTSAGEVGIWVAGEQWAVCEQSGRIATAHRARPLGSRAEGKEAFDFSTSTYDWTTREYFTAYVAGGPLDVSFERITYTFPDGHTEKARIATDAEGRRWWSVAYLPTEGLMTNGNSSKWEPVEVRDALSGMVYTYSLDWYRNGCAQVNHGC